jgi:hypothetical protein
LLKNSRAVALTAAMAGTLAVGACGSDEKNDNQAREAVEQESSPQVAITEIGETQAGLKKGLAAYDPATPARADEIVAETYLQHFEKVEGPLGKVDPELNEELEEAISGEIRGDIKKKVPRTELERLVKSTQADLETAKEKLR